MISSSATVGYLKRKLHLLYEVPFHRTRVTVNNIIVSDQDIISTLTEDHSLKVTVWFDVPGRGGGLTGV